jgi:hypothetical protein
MHELIDDFVSLVAALLDRIGNAVLMCRFKASLLTGWGPFFSSCAVEYTTAVSNPLLS